jgi:hypothetical protein
VNTEASQALFEEQTTQFSGELLELRKWRMVQHSCPILDVCFEQPGRTAMRVRMMCDDWNELPPSVTLLAEDGTALPAAPTGPTGIFHQGPHPLTGHLFVCMAGIREYHTHSSHTADLWENYRTRSGYDLGGILTRIWNGWLKSQP